MSTLKFKEPELQYITRNGKRTGVVLSINEYNRLLQLIEDLRDTISAELRKKQPTIEYSSYRSKRLARQPTKR